MIRIVFKILVVIICGLVLGVIGFLVGAHYGGNYAQQFEFLNTKGYEATGLVGFFLGALAGIACSSWFFMKRKGN